MGVYLIDQFVEEITPTSSQLGAISIVTYLKSMSWCNNRARCSCELYFSHLLWWWLDTSIDMLYDQYQESRWISLDLYQDIWKVLENLRWLQNRYCSKVFSRQRTSILSVRQHQLLIVLEAQLVKIIYIQHFQEGKDS